MVRFVALLVMLAACNAGPLQWSDASEWYAAESVVACAGLPADLCSEISGRVVAAAGGARLVAGSSPELAFVSCITRIDPATGATRPPRSCSLQTPETSTGRVIYVYQATFARVTTTTSAYAITADAEWTVTTGAATGAVTVRSVFSPRR